MSTIGGIVIAILILLLMITIHELGHYFAGRKLGFKINEFAIGFGPKLWSRKNKHGITISIRAFPLGGFCAFEDDDDIVGKYVEGGNERAKEENERRDETAPQDLRQDKTEQQDAAPPEKTPTGKKFSEQKPWKRMVVLAMGAIFNIASAVVFSFILLLAFGNMFKTTAVRVAEVYNNDTKGEQWEIVAD
jgi:regulator of sigma E protease